MCPHFWGSSPHPSHHGALRVPCAYTRFSLVKVAQLCLTFCDPLDRTVHGILQARILEWVAFLFSRDRPNPGIQPRSPALQVDSLPAEPPGKPKHPGVGSLFLLQQIFLTHELNQWPLHCRQILYQLNGQVLISYLFYTYLYIYVNPNFSIHATLVFPLGVHAFALCLCVSVSALQIGSSVPNEFYMW